MKILSLLLMSVINFLPASRFKDRPVPPGCFVVPDVFIPHLFDEAPVQIWYGSRFSAKSATKARELLGRAAGQEYFRGIYARQSKTDVKNSQFQLFKDIISAEPWLDEQFIVRSSDYVIENRITGNLLIPGSFDDPQKIMSTADPTDIWVEEPITAQGEIKRKDFLSMFGSLRNSQGVPPRFHLTFNPISTETWIYQDFFDKKIIPSHQVLANYDDNPFCPPSAHEFFAWLKEADPEKYEVDGLGLWGQPRTGKEYLYNFSYVKHVKPVQFIPGYPVHLPWDFNVNPYLTMGGFQIVPRGDGGYIVQQFDEFCLEHPRNRVEAVGEEYLNRYWYPYPVQQRSQAFLYGDAQGNNRVEGKGDERRFDWVKDALRPVLHHNSDRTLRKNPPVIRQRDFMNNTLAGKHPIDWVIDPRCKNTIQDFQKLKQGADGGFLKEYAIDAAGAKYEKYGHCYTMSSYLAVGAFPDLFENDMIRK